LACTLARRADPLARPASAHSQKELTGIFHFGYDSEVTPPGIQGAAFALQKDYDGYCRFKIREKQISQARVKVLKNIGGRIWPDTQQKVVPGRNL
jgi:hypothetical protein